MICGKEWIAQYNNNFCSKECSYKAYKIYKNNKYQNNKEAKEYKCKECGRKYIPEHNGRNRFCSKFCANKYQKRPQRHKRRARIKGLPYESVDPIKVFKRDNYVCQLCGRKTLRSKRGTIHPRAPELDHIIPIAQGGGHLYQNVQCVCRECNNIKGDKSIGQLRMF